MKIDEILLIEYDRARAIQAIGPNLWRAMLRDMLNLNIPLKDFDKQFQERYPTSFNMYKDSLTDKETQENLANKAMMELEKADPTTNKKYSQWLGRMFASDPRTKLEDLESTAAEYLYKFNKLGLKKMLKGTDSDLNRYKTLKDFMNVMDHYELPVEDENQKGKAEKLYSDDTVTVVHPEDEAAACQYGRQTRWCTAAVRGSNFFDHYDRQGPLYILIPKSPKHQGEKYQLHFPTDQFMNEDDEQIALVPLITERFPGLLEFFRVREPEALKDLIELAPDDVLKPILDKIADIMTDHINDVILDWEIRDDYYYQWLKDEGFVNKDGDIADNAPGYLEYNDEADRFYNEAIDAVTQSPDNIRHLASVYKHNEPDEPTSIDHIENVMIWNMRSDLDRDSADSLADYMHRRVHVYKDKEGNWQVKHTAER